MKFSVRTAVLALIACSVNMKAQTQVTPFNPGITAEGVNYVLPATRIRVDVTAMKTTYHPGEYAKYANRYLNFENVKMSVEEKCFVTDMQISTEGVPDTSKMYTIKLKDKTVAPNAKLTDNGILLAINTDSDVPEYTSVDSEVSTNNRLDARLYFTSEILAATSTAKMAQFVSEEIVAIRESKNVIMRGQAETMPKDGPSLQIVIDGLNKQEKALTQLFTGYVDTVTYVRSYYVTPDADIKDHVLFRISSKLGLVDADDLSGEPFYLSVKNLNTVPQPAITEPRKLEGVVYNVPAMAEVSIYTPEQQYVKHEMPMGQFGVVDVLSGSLFNKNAKTKVTFNSVTGGIVKVEQ